MKRWLLRAMLLGLVLLSLLGSTAVVTAAGDAFETYVLQPHGGGCGGG
jgi:hypothetical protein